MISAIIITKNEEKNIHDCVESVLWCDEIIVIDDNSDDLTNDVLGSFSSDKIKIFKNSLADDFSAQRNFGLEKARGDWALFIDADERVSFDLREEINEAMIAEKDSKIKGFYIRRVDYIWGKKMKYGETGNLSLIRLARKNSGKWSGKIHEEWNVRGKIGELDNHLDHYPHQSITDFLKEINLYTDLRAKELYDQKIPGKILHIIVFPLGKFIYNFFVKLGFLDGTQGLIFALMMSFHSFLVRAKLWLLWRKI